jgi:hypothetical protein
MTAIHKPEPSSPGEVGRSPGALRTAREAAIFEAIGDLIAVLDRLEGLKTEVPAAIERAGDKMSQRVLTGCNEAARHIELSTANVVEKLLVDTNRLGQSLAANAEKRVSDAVDNSVDNFNKEVRKFVRTTRYVMLVCSLCAIFSAIIAVEVFTVANGPLHMNSREDGDMRSGAGITVRR